jgi:hypothetical protein
MKLAEIANSRLNLTWSSHGESYATKFFVDKIQYGISADRTSFEGINALEVFFYSIRDGKQDMSLLNLGNNEFKVIGIVGNAIKEQFNGEHVIWFSAKYGVDKNQVEKRASLYSKLAAKFARENNYFRAEGMVGDNYLYILFDNTSYQPKIDEYLGIKRDNA